LCGPSRIEPPADDGFDVSIVSAYSAANHPAPALEAVAKPMNSSLVDASMVAAAMTPLMPGAGRADQMPNFPRFVPLT